jgi:hypothetical protein
MDKEQKPIMDAVLRTSFRSVVYRSISILLLKRVGEHLDTIRIDAPAHVTAEQIVQIKRQYAQELLQDDKVKKDAQLELDDIYRNKTDLIAEILRQYALDKNKSERTDYHDTLSVLFDECLWNIRLMVNKGRWKELGV